VSLVEVDARYVPRALCRAHTRRRGDTHPTWAWKRRDALGCADCARLGGDRIDDRTAYIGRRGQYAGDAGPLPLFDARGRIVGLEDARGALRAARGDDVTYHRLIVSLDARSPIATPAAARTWAAYVLGDLAAYLDARPVVAAAVHLDSGNAHMHALIGGVAARDDHRVPVEIRRPHLEMLRTKGAERARQVAQGIRGGERERQGGDIGGRVTR
jgi:hypothetical protein